MYKLDKLRNRQHIFPMLDKNKEKQDKVLNQ